MTSDVPTLVPYDPATLTAAWRDVVATVPAPPGAHVVGGPVAYEHDGQTFEGYVARDLAATGLQPVVLVVHDWTGVGPAVVARAHMLARLGYVAFCVDVYGAGVRPTGDAAAVEAGRYYGDLTLLRDRVAAGMTRALSEPDVDPARVAVVGYCFGGSAALELARTGADLRGAVCVHGRLVPHEPSDAGTIRGSVLVLTGGADPVVPDADVQAFADELRAADVTWEIAAYSGAPHAFTIAGSPSYRARADRRSWAAMTSFLADVLGRG
ncbi:dienelactone hydrolase family protein [Luteimicrobium subarcticum]|uniref:Dienelactone hydrolase n=1 Tax=Luteimicrobium subarcticum TaxID=620910 RepID=A0A2M8WRR0_9MICO|nr:dienelactone hydrolase family protein [Luteimicrobium subarcticum]PJI93598.1 dienelactone hydrolase [Luteimicrobium subarcticum]